MSTLKCSEIESSLCSDLFVLRARAIERLLVRGGTGDEARVFEFGVARDQLRLSFEDGSLGAPMARADAKARSRALLFVRGETSRIPVDTALRARGRHRFVVQCEGAYSAGMQEQRLEPVRRDVKTW